MFFHFFSKIKAADNKKAYATQQGIPRARRAARSPPDRALVRDFPRKNCCFDAAGGGTGAAARLARLLPLHRWLCRRPPGGTRPPAPLTSRRQHGGRADPPHARFFLARDADASLAPFGKAEPGRTRGGLASLASRGRGVARC